MNGRHDAVQAVIDLSARPREADGVLAHFQAGSGDAARVARLAGRVEDACLEEGFGRFQGGGHVRAFGDTGAAVGEQGFRVALVQLVLRGARQGDVGRHAPGTFAGEEFQPCSLA